MLKLSNIIKHYVTGDTTVAALSGISVEFRKNEFVSILGHSGCGKTTLLNIIGGLDQYTDGDSYDDPTYIACFRLVLQAVREKRKLRVRFRGHTGLRHSIVCVPLRIEYSPKDDKFRLLTAGDAHRHVINLARVRSCEVLEAYTSEEAKTAKPRTREVTFLLREERNALERVLLHFSHLEKETVRLEEDLYQVTLRYDKEDETELLIRILSFGPVLQVTASDSFIALIHERLARQKIIREGNKHETI